MAVLDGGSIRLDDDSPRLGDDDSPRLGDDDNPRLGDEGTLGLGDDGTLGIGDDGTLGLGDDGTTDRLLSAVTADAVDPERAESGWILSALSVSIGRSAMPIIMLPRVPIRAPAPPVIGSQGPSSVSYSRGRYLKYVSISLSRVGLWFRAHSLRSPNDKIFCSFKTQATAALSLMLVRFTRQTAARSGNTEHRILSTSSI